MDKARRVLVVLVVALCLLPPSVRARVWYVRSDGTGDAPTIGAAIDSAAAQDTVLLSKGVFREESLIRVINKSNLCITSEGGPDSTTIAPSAESSYMSVGACTTLAIDGITFAGFPGLALSLDMSAGIIVSKCNFFNNGYYYLRPAILINWCDGTSVQDCNISGNSSGITYYELNSNVVIHSSTFFANTRLAINLNDVTCCNISNCIVSGNSSGIFGFGMYIDLQCNDVFNNGTNYDIMGYPDPTGLNGNISVDPQFCSIDPVAYNNYFLQSDSPCAPGNHPSGYPCGLIGCKPVGCSTVGTEKADWSKVKQLFK